MSSRVIVLMMVLVGAAMGTGVKPPASPAPAASPAPPAKPAAGTSAKPSTPAPAASPAAVAALRIRGAGLKDLDLSMADIKAMPHRTVTVKDKDEKPVAYSGVIVEEILTKAGVAFGHSLRGPRMRDYLLAEAADGYAVVFALAEISTEFSDRLVIIADAADGKPLADKEGPLKVIVSDEKKHARWVRNVVALSIHTCEAEKEKK